MHSWKACRSSRNAEDYTSESSECRGLEYDDTRVFGSEEIQVSVCSLHRRKFASLVHIHQG